MNVNEVLQCLEQEDDGIDWNISEDDEDYDDELDDAFTEATVLDPLDCAQADEPLPGK